VFSHSQVKDPLVIQGEIEWSGDEYFQKFRARGPEALGGHFASFNPLESQPWAFAIKNSAQFILYDPTAKHIALMGREDGNSMHFSVFEMSPSDLWYRCRPTLGSNGRPWPDMVGGPAAKPWKVRFEKIDDDLVRRIRDDPDGSTSEIVFSMVRGGNPVRSTFRSANPRYGDQNGGYRWTKAGKAWVLDSCDYTTFLAGRRDVPDEIYTVVLTDVVIQESRGSRFPLQRIMNLVGPDTKVQDDTTGRTYRVGLKQEIRVEEP
jgi:hypothetical protein